MFFTLLLRTDSRFTELERTSNEEKIILEDLKLEKKEENSVCLSKPVLKSNIIAKKRKRSKNNEENYSTKKKTAIEEIIEEELKEKEFKEMRKREKQEIPWLIKNIVIKITSKALGEKYYKQKAEIIEVVNKFKAIVKLIQDGGSKIQVDQNQIETVIPALGKQVIVLRGKYKSEKAILDSLDMENFSAKLKLCDNNNGLAAVSLPYEHFSKMCSAID